MELRKKIPTIEDCNHYLIKTNNGKYYQEYKEYNRVRLFNMTEQDEVTGKKLSQYLLFKEQLKIGDIVIIPSTRNKLICIGKIVSDTFAVDATLYKKVLWLKEISYIDLDFKFHKYFYTDAVIVLINDLHHSIERILYQVYNKNNLYHFVLKVNQKDNIQCKSIYGLQNLFLSGQNINDLEIKINVQSPGIIEFITKNIDVVTLIMKILKFILCIQSKKIESKLDKLLKEEYDAMIDKYFKYEVDKLELDVPDVEEYEIRM